MSVSVRRGVDKRGWDVIECAPCGESGTWVLEFSISGELIKLVVQKQNSVRVYVNPDLDECNELEAPAGNGARLHICKRKEPVPKTDKLAANRPAATATCLLYTSPSPRD